MGNFTRSPPGENQTIIDALTVDKSFLLEAKQSIHVGAGLVLLKCLFGFSAEELATAQRRTGSDFVTPAFPGYWLPVAGWTSDLPRILREEPRLEKDLADVVFGRSVPEFRLGCDGITSELARTLQRVATDQWRSSVWGLGPVGKGWSEWCSTLGPRGFDCPHLRL